MRIASRGAGVALATASLVVAAAVPTLGQSQAPGDWPNSGTLKDGSTFTLKPGVAEKVAAGEPFNYLFSYQSSSIPLFSAQYQAGYDAGLEAAQAITPVNGQIVAPAAATGDVNEQIAQIQAQIDAGQVDCLSIQPATSDGFTAITNSAMAAGIPVFTVGVTSNGNELTNFTQVPLKEGAQAAQIVLDWEEATGNDLKVFAVSGGDPTQFWAQGRMQGFIEGIMAGDPEATFINDAATGLSTSYDPAATYSAYQALIQGNPELQFIENVDIGAEHANKAITDAGKAGQIFTIGWNVSLGQLDGIDAGTQVAALDQRWAEQAGFGAQACADFLKNGIIRPNTQELLPVTKENSAEAREDLNSILNQ
jgi:ribose transport system substrate-binding protein